LQTKDSAVSKCGLINDWKRLVTQVEMTSVDKLTLKKVDPDQNRQNSKISLPPNPLIVLIRQNHTLITNQRQSAISMSLLRIRGWCDLSVLNVVFVVHLCVFSEESDAFLVLGR
jgi:hypothetical protein